LNVAPRGAKKKGRARAPVPDGGAAGEVAAPPLVAPSLAARPPALPPAGREAVLPDAVSG